MISELSASAALEAVRYWAALHGARLLLWQPVPPALYAVFDREFAAQERLPEERDRALPRRRRGKGLFREAK